MWSRACESLEISDSDSAVGGEERLSFSESLATTLSSLPSTIRAKRNVKRSEMAIGSVLPRGSQMEAAC
eukprot:scaffold2552_cov380-Prasinococcus_capsulatus_cf.AAC.41